MYWEQLTLSQLNKISSTVPVVMNVAAVEQHGPALPVAVDSIIGEAICREVDKALPEKVLILPQAKIGCSAHHMQLGATLTLSHATFIQYITEIVESTYTHGFKKFFIINSHGGNIAASQVITESCGARYPDLKIANTSWWKLAQKRLQDLNEGGDLAVGHACEFETSLIAYILNRKFNLEDFGDYGLTPVAKEYQATLLRSPEVSWYRDFKTMTKNGIYGDPSYANPEKGEKILSTVSKELARILTDF